MGVHQAMFIFVSSTICSRLCWTTMSRLFIKNKKLKILQSIIKLMNFSLNMIWIFSSLTNLFIVSRISLRNLTDDGESHAHHRLSFRLSRYLLARNATQESFYFWKSPLESIMVSAKWFLTLNFLCGSLWMLSSSLRYFMQSKMRWKKRHYPFTFSAHEVINALRKEIRLKWKFSSKSTNILKMALHHHELPLMIFSARFMILWMNFSFFFLSFNIKVYVFVQIH